MEIETSTQAYEIFRKLRDREKRVKKQNGSCLFSKPKEKYLFIKVLKERTLNLLEESEKIIVKTNILGNYSAYWGIDLKEFFEELKSFMSLPYYNFFIQNNRRRENKVSFWWVAKFRNMDFEFSDIKIEIGEEAGKQFSNDNYDFFEEIKKIIENKKIPTEEDINYFERYFFLYNRIEDLVRQKKKEAYSSYYYSREDEDKTLKISISDEEYNEKLKEVEIELKGICKKYPYLKMPTLNFIEIE